MQTEPRGTCYRETANYLHRYITELYYPALNKHNQAEDESSRHVSCYTPDQWWIEQPSDAIDGVLRGIQDEETIYTPHRFVILAECISDHNNHFIDMEREPFAELNTGIRLTIKRGLKGRIVLHDEMKTKGMVCINSLITSSYNGNDLPLMVSTRFVEGNEPFACSGGIYGYIYFSKECTVQDFVEDGIRQVLVF